MLKKIEITLETEDSEVSSYLDGYLTGIHDIGWHRIEKIFAHENKHQWLVTIKNDRDAYAHMTDGEIARDLVDQLRYIGYMSVGFNFKQRKYEIQVSEIKED